MGSAEELRRSRQTPRLARLVGPISRPPCSQPLSYRRTFRLSALRTLAAMRYLDAIFAQLYTCARVTATNLSDYCWMRRSTSRKTGMPYHYLVLSLERYAWSPWWTLINRYGSPFHAIMLLKSESHVHTLLCAALSRSARAHVMPRRAVTASSPTSESPASLSKNSRLFLAFLPPSLISCDTSTLSPHTYAFPILLCISPWLLAPEARAYLRTSVCISLRPGAYVHRDVQRAL